MIPTLFPDLNLVGHLVLGVFAVLATAWHHHYRDCFGMRRQTLLTGVRMAAPTALVSNGQIQVIVAFGLVSLLFGATAALVGGLRRLILLLLVVYGVQGQHHIISNDYYYPL